MNIKYIKTRDYRQPKVNYYLDLSPIQYKRKNGAFQKAWEQDLQIKHVIMYRVGKLDSLICLEQANVFGAVQIRYPLSMNITVILM